MMVQSITFRLVVIVTEFVLVGIVAVVEIILFINAVIANKYTKRFS